MITDEYSKLFWDKDEDFSLILADLAEYIEDDQFKHTNNSRDAGGHFLEYQLSSPNSDFNSINESINHSNSSSNDLFTNFKALSPLSCVASNPIGTWEQSLSDELSSSNLCFNDLSDSLFNLDGYADSINLEESEFTSFNNKCESPNEDYIYEEDTDDNEDDYYFRMLATNEHYSFSNLFDDKQSAIFDWMKGVSSSKKRRQVYTRIQTFELEKEYCFSRYLSRKRRHEIAKQINLTDRQVKIWFQNRRMKEKRNKIKESYRRKS
ncbi:hypothetical protein GJ496_004947 [Pomphorhynchus laevis]|nr:hypothetical protein GJ496_004947 [Pomphorhynchus laevis]